MLWVIRILEQLIIELLIYGSFWSCADYISILYWNLHVHMWWFYNCFGDKFVTTSVTKKLVYTCATWHIQTDTWTPTSLPGQQTHGRTRHLQYTSAAAWHDTSATTRQDTSAAAWHDTSAATWRDTSAATWQDTSAASVANVVWQPDGAACYDENRGTSVTNRIRHWMNSIRWRWLFRHWMNSIQWRK